MRDDGDGKPRRSTLPSSPPVIRPHASFFEPFNSSATERGHRTHERSHFWDSSPTETPSHGKHRATNASSLPQAKRQCVGGISTDVNTPETPPDEDVTQAPGTARIALQTPGFTELPHTPYTLAKEGPIPNVVLGADLSEDPYIYEPYLYPDGASEFDELFSLINADQNYAAINHSEALPHGRQTLQVAQKVRDATPEPAARAEDEDELPQLPHPSNPPGNPESDGYGFTSSAENEVDNLEDSAPTAMSQLPPSSVIRDMVPTSSVYDSALKRSPPGQTVNLSKEASKEEDLMDYEMDWDEVLKVITSHTKDSSVIGKSDHHADSAAVPTITNTPAAKTLEPTHDFRAAQGLQATQSFQAAQAKNSGPSQTQFVRPPFPSPVKDKSPIPGLSHSVVAQICFRIGELLNRASKCHLADQDAIFELYARVKSSSRESSARVQNFEFMDLFKNHPPHPPGTLTGWKAGSRVDKESAAFLALAKDQTPMMCKCMCKMKKVAKGKEANWVVEVMFIGQVDWDDIDWIKHIAFRGQ